MGGDIDDVVNDLRENGFKSPRDFIYFDAAAIAIEETLPHLKKMSPQSERKLPYVITEAGGWLKIGIDADGIYVSYTEDP
jgi:hypothetical protein